MTMQPLSIRFHIAAPELRTVFHIQRPLTSVFPSLATFIHHGFNTMLIESSSSFTLWTHHPFVSLTIPYPISSTPAASPIPSISARNTALTHRL